jgi:hypothetical protein
MSKTIKCAKCNDEMVQGFIPDFHLPTQNVPPQTRVSRWFEGPPKKSFWSGTDAQHSGGIPIGAFRCGRCGLLEFYASEGFAAK